METPAIDNAAAVLCVMRYVLDAGIYFAAACVCRFKIGRRDRRASFTLTEFGNSLATKGSRTTILVPLAYIFAYLPLTPDEKSYSAFISAQAFLVMFFIIPSFPAGGRPDTNDSDILPPVTVGNHM